MVYGSAMISAVLPLPQKRMDCMPDFGSWLLDRREKRGLSKLALSKKAGVSDVIIGYWETGERSERSGGGG